MNKKILYLEGFRGIAAFIVLISHLKEMFNVEIYKNLLLNFVDIPFSKYFIHPFFHFFTNGNLAVHLFWVMSGYVISIKLFQLRDQNYLISSFMKRYFRLMIPAFSSIIFAFILLSFGLMFNNELATYFEIEYSRNDWLFDLYNFEPNFILMLKDGIWNTFFDFKYSSSYNGVLWTMNPELYGSFACFFIFAVFSKHKLRHYIYILFFLLSIPLKIYWLGTFMIGFMLSDFDNNSFVKNTFIENVWKNVLSKKLINISFFMVVVFLSGIFHFKPFFNFLTSILLILILMRTKSIQKLFINPFFLWLGKISFSLYLIHIPILCSLTSWLFLFLKDKVGYIENMLICSLVTIATTFILAAFFTKYIDLKSVKIANKIGAFFKENKKVG
ncbi:acyltransferase family protein [Aureivirga sp. CE67]|uniref:acyltransferase family protein n=1 Tax=Aureivirga sp. CE67 TaxID=1788983 RepID=UPI0018CB12B7|nr:acyltransferase [Aureivirga sp. CE67]